MSCDTVLLPAALAVPCVRAALALLEGAYRCALILGRPPWDFALTETELSKTGVTDDHLTGLAAAGLLEWRSGTAPATHNGAGRSRVPKVLRGPALLFVLTQAGADLASRNRVGGGNAVPRWDPFRCELWLGDRLVKRFHRAARNQEYVLTCLQEAGWPERLEIALPDCKPAPLAHRLRETVKSLNQGQAPPCIGFRVCADGQSVRWQLLA
jgi:hypothetical protein